MKFAVVFFFATIFAFALANPVIVKHLVAQVVLDQSHDQQGVNQNISTAELNKILEANNPFTLRDAEEIQERLKDIPLENTTVTQ